MAPSYAIGVLNSGGETEIYIMGSDSCLISDYGVPYSGTYFGSYDGRRFTPLMEVFSEGEAIRVMFEKNSLDSVMSQLKSSLFIDASVH